MSLRGFQRALADLVASPALCAAVEADPRAALAAYDLDARERRRVADMAGRPGMAVNRALYRATRATPALTLLPLSCFLLGERLRAELERFWADGEDDPRMDRETLRFGALLRARLASGEIREPALDEVLAFETASLELQLPDLDRDLPSAGPLRLHPRVRAVRFGRDPAALLERLAERAPPPYTLEEGEFWLVIDAREETWALRVVPPAVGRIVSALEAGNPIALAPDDAAALVEAGLVLDAARV